MSDQIKDMIKSAMDKNAAEFENQFNGIMGDKMSDALQQTYDAMFGVRAEAEAESEIDVDDETPEAELETEE